MITEHERGDAPDCAYPPHPRPGTWDDDDSKPVPVPAGQPATASRTGAAPAGRAGWLAVPAVWTAAEIMHAAGVPGYGPGLAAGFATAAAFGVGEYRARRSEHPVLEGTELTAAIGVPGAWLTAATVTGPLWGHYDLMTSVVYSAVTVGGWQWLKRRKAFRAARARRAMAAAVAARLAAEEAAWLAKKNRMAPAGAPGRPARIRPAEG